MNKRKYSLSHITKRQKKYTMYWGDKNFTTRSFIVDCGIYVCINMYTLHANFAACVSSWKLRYRAAFFVIQNK